MDTGTAPSAPFAAESATAADPPPLHPEQDEAALARHRHMVSPAPHPPEDIQSAATLAPDHRRGMVDPAWHGDGPPPS
ncbi:hypothetical protein ACFXKI_54475 [Streptomyces mirabilis]|uniref:hypothetical protein n=1 Tax=Streptomyces mirabilis TaxID=68239 RepID=UPI0036A7596C